MGACSDPRADRTRFIINEDFKLKMEMIQSIQNFNKKKNGEDIGVYRSKNNESNQINKHDIPNVNIPANGNVIRKNTRDLTEEYEIEGQLGEGGYGKVYLVRHKRMNLLRAMKVISIDSKHTLLSFMFLIFSLTSAFILQDSRLAFLLAIYEFVHILAFAPSPSIFKIQSQYIFVPSFKSPLTLTVISLVR